jgi:hypothetical protein
MASAAVVQPLVAGPLLPSPFEGKPMDAFRDHTLTPAPPEVGRPRLTGDK